MNPKCDRCGEKLTEPGGLLFGPPNEHGDCRKWHLCKLCYRDIIEGLLEGLNPNHPHKFIATGRNPGSPANPCAVCHRPKISVMHELYDLETELLYAPK